MEYLNQIFSTFNNLENSVYVMAGFLGFCALAILLRILVYIGYQTQIMLFKHHAKELKSKSEIKNTFSNYLNRIVNDYVRIGEKAVVPDARMIVTKNMLKFNFLGLSYKSLEELIKSIEQNAIFLGIILTFVFEEYRYVFAITTTLVFALHKLFSAVFDFISSKESLAQESIEYLEREIGQFYAGDMGSIFLRLKNEMSAAILRQSENLGDSIKKLGMDLSGVIQLSMQEMSRSIDKAMIRISAADGELFKPLEKWQVALSETVNAQEQFAVIIKQVGDASSGFNLINDNLKKTLNDYSSLVNTQALNLKEQHSSLDRVSDIIRDTSEPLVSAVDALSSQLKYIERNQNILESSIQKYELTLEDVTRKLGDGLSNIIDFNMQSSYNVLNKHLEDNIKNILNANNELAQRIQDVLEQVLQQSRSESQVMIKIKEQMDMQFESLHSKL